jgi:endonuclease YncB( thermonuclease family)
MAVLLGLATLFGSAPSRADEVEVLSGDTIRVGQNEYRIANIDAPRLDGRCQAERQLASLAQAKLAEFLAQGDMEIAPTGERDQDGRPMAHVRMNGEDVGDKMVGVSLAQRHGSARSLCPADRSFDPMGQMMGGMR